MNNIYTPYLIICFLFFGFIGFLAALDYGLEREAMRLDAVKEYNCQHYGAKMNADYRDGTCQVKQTLRR